jgi:hypothetical protein
MLENVLKIIWKAAAMAKLMDYTETIKGRASS